MGQSLYVMVDLGSYLSERLRWLYVCFVLIHLVDDKIHARSTGPYSSYSATIGERLNMVSDLEKWRYGH